MSKEVLVAETVEDDPAWLAMSDEEFERGYVLAPEQVPRMYAFHRHPALLGDDVPGPSGPVAWGLRFASGDLVTVVLPESGGIRILHGDSVEHLEQRLGTRLDAELCWLSRPADSAWRLEPAER